MTNNKKIVCPLYLQRQCLNPVNSKGCKLRYFNRDCLLAIKEKKQAEKVVSK